MALSALDDKSQDPTDVAVAGVLGSAKELWDELCDNLASEFPPLTKKWSYSGKQWGWSLALKRKKRTIVYLTPSDSFFYAGFALGERAVGEVSQGGLSPAVLALIQTAQKYAEGRAVRLEIRRSEDVVQALIVARAKMKT